MNREFRISNAGFQRGTCAAFLPHCNKVFAPFFAVEVGAIPIEIGILFWVEEALASDTPCLPLD